MTNPAGADLARSLARVRRRWQQASWLTTAGYAAAAAALPLAAVPLLASRAGATVLLAVVVLAVFLCAAAALTVAIGWRAARPDDRRVARFVGERASTDGTSEALGDALVSAVDVLEAGRSPGPFDALVVSRAVQLVERVDPSALVTRVEMRRAWLGAALGTALLLWSTMAAAPHVARAAATAWLALIPQSIRITALTGDVRVPAGQPLLITASVAGPGARWLAEPPRLVVSADGEDRAVEMRPAGGAFEYAVDTVDRTFAYRVTAGRASSIEHLVTALHPARVTRIDLEYRYPPFTGLESRLETDSGDIYGPAGTSVRLLVHSDKDIASASITLTGGRVVPLSLTGRSSASADLVLEHDDAYRVGLTDADGLRSRDDVEYYVRIMTDRPPDVHIIRPASDQGIFPLQEVVIEARARDDHGIASFDLVYQVAGREARAVAFARVEGTAVSRTGVHILEAEALGVEPGDVITYHARARDVPRGRPSVEARSELFFLEVTPFAEEFVSAGSQAMGAGSSGTQIDGLIAAQKEIISAAWNLERRSGAGRSAEDLEAVGRAQADLKARTEQLLVRGRGGWRGGLLPQQVQPLSPARTRGGLDHIGAAVDAMGRAAEELGRQRTADAIPHGTAALQALFRAQAEVRRRQVLQQAAGAGGSSRGDRDLSTLFDRELQRQQRTSYETPPQSAPDEPTRESGDLADRLRDLARRQDELARQQRELAGSTSEVRETRRQLERLAREQAEVRRQLDELVRRKDSGSGRDGRGSSAAMSDAAGAMRQAAEAASQRDAERAAAQGERAAEALRQAERLARAGSPEARRQMAGALPIEAHQIAEAQRRLAAEANRVGADSGRSGTAVREARRRLADEQDRLADRVDALEQAARDLAGDLPGRDRSRVDGALQHLDAERVGEQMRADAGRIRDTDAPGVDRDGRIARALERLSDALGDLRGASGGWTPEHHEFSRSDPGAGAARQDLREWGSLRKGLDRTIAHHDKAPTDGARSNARDERLHAGRSESVPDPYRAAVARYFEALAKAGK